MTLPAPTSTNIANIANIANLRVILVPQFYSSGRPPA